MQYLNKMCVNDGMCTKCKAVWLITLLCIVMLLLSLVTVTHTHVTVFFTIVALFKAGKFLKHRNVSICGEEHCISLNTDGILKDI